MQQQQLEELQNDGVELFGHNDQTELASFFEYLATKYELKFDEAKYMHKAYPPYLEKCLCKGFYKPRDCPVHGNGKRTPKSQK